MNKAVVFISLLFIILVIGGIVVYFIYEKPFEENVYSLETKNFTIKFIDNDKQIATNYIITLDNANIIYKKGVSLESGLIYEKLPINHTFYIFNENIADQNYYSSYKYVNDFSNDIIYNEIELTAPLNITLNYTGNLNSKVSIFTNVSFAKCSALCVRGSQHIVLIKLNLTEITIPLRLKDKVDKCYRLGDLQNNYSIFDVDYKTFGEILESDYIRVLFLDGDMPYYSKDSCIYEDKHNNDINAKDVILEIKI